MARDRNSRESQVGLDWQTASLPLSGGLDVRTNRRMRPKEKLTELNNGRFVARNSIGKRLGHRSYAIINDDFVGEPPLPSLWAYGNGKVEEAFFITGNTLPAGQCKGVFTVGDALVAWTGDRLFTRQQGTQFWNGQDITAVKTSASADWDGIRCGLPVAEETPVFFNSTNKATNVSCADGLYHRVIAWTTETAVYVRVIALDTGEIVTHAQEVSGDSDEPGKIMAMYLGGALVILWNDIDAEILYWVQVNDLTGTIGEADERKADVAAFDVDKYNDTYALLVWMQPDFVIKAEAFDKDGVIESWLASNTTLDLDGKDPADRYEVACSVNGSRQFTVVWAEGGTATPPVQARSYAGNGDPLSLGALELLASGKTILALGSCAATRGNFYAGVTYEDGAVLTTKFCWHSSAMVEKSFERHMVRLASKMFCVGGTPHALLVSRPGANVGADVHQSSYYLVSLFIMSGWDAKLSPVGIHSHGEAGLPTGGGALNSGIDTRPDGRFSFDFKPGQHPQNRVLWSTVVTERDDEWAVDAGSAETKARHISLDFLPRLQSATAGGNVYIAGAMPRVFDGATLAEAGFYEYPEVLSDTKGTNGALTASGVYRYRVYFCRRLKDGSIFRSPALTYTADALAGAEDEIELTVTTLSMTTDPDVYYEVYRTIANEATPYYLVSGGNPQAATRNTFSTSTTTITDGMSDAVAAVQLQDSFNPSIGQVSELEETGAPNCAGLAYLNDRLWAFGGAIDRGKVMFSKTMEIGEGVGFNDNGVLEFSVDRSGAPVTAVGAIQSIPVIFRERDVFAIAGNGPDNFGYSSFDLPRFISTDAGALNQQSVATCPEGLVFWSRFGPRLLGNDLRVTTIGDEIQPATKGFVCTGALLVTEQSQVRFYGEGNKAFIWDYMLKQWSIYTGLATEGVCMLGDKAVLARLNGSVYVETDDTWTDGGTPYEFSIMTGDLSPDGLIQGASRWRRWALVGEWRGPHELHYEVFRAGSNLISEQGDWEPEEDTGLEHWGTGSGTFGVAGSSSWPDPDESSTDGVYRARRRFKAENQKASLVRMRFSDKAAAGDSFILSELAFELGTKPGLTRLPPRTFE